MQGRGSGKVRDFALYGETTGETDEFGLPVRYNWAAEYRGQAMVVYGHTPVPEPEWLNRTINIDTGCVFGGKLTALRYPERELVSVPARRGLLPSPRKPFLPAEELRRALTAQQRDDDLLDIDDVLGKRIIATRLAPQRDDPRGERDRGAGGDEPLRRQSEVADLPAADHVAVARRASEPGLLEHPARGVRLLPPARACRRVVCEEKHMGSRAVVDRLPRRGGRAAALRHRRRGLGICYTRTGRRFFDDDALETELPRPRPRRAPDARGAVRTSSRPTGLLSTAS